VLVATGDQVGLVKPVVASTTTALSLAQVIVKPKPLAGTPKLAAQGHACLFAIRSGPATGFERVPAVESAIRTLAFMLPIGNGRLNRRQ
jgi:hypothetical protein